MNTPLIKLSLFFLLGVISGHYFSFSLETSGILLVLCLLIFFVSYIRAQKNLFPDPLFGSAAFLAFLAIGIFTIGLHAPQNQPGHFTNLPASKDTAHYNLVIQESLKSDLYNHKYIARLNELDGKAAHGKLLLLQPKETENKKLIVGQQVLLFGQPAPISAPLNPYQFDYSWYMRTKGILQQIQLNSTNHVLLPSSNLNIRAKAEHLRTRIVEKLKQNGFQKEELAIIQALLLGQKQDISIATYNNFANAGVIHILAVSGLHVGIMLLILNFIFAPIGKLRHGKIIATLLILICLWGFALLAGLSPSVVRAVSMFSFIAIGMQLRRRSSTLNAIFLSLLLLLLINPLWIFEVGFQLSYCAVLAIVILQPILYKSYEPGNKITRYFWSLITVTIAAQIGVLPLSLFYFHQFPGLFFLSNLIILPFLGFILSFGVLMIILAMADLLPIFLAELYESLIRLLNAFVAEVAAQEHFLFRDISFSLTGALFAYFLLIGLLVLYYSFSYRKMIIFLALLVLFQSHFLLKDFKPSYSFTVFHRSGKTILAKELNDSLIVFSPLKETPEDLPIIRNFIIEKDLDQVSNEELKNIYLIKSELLLVIDSTTVYPQGVKPKYLLLSHSPIVNLERLIKQLDPEVIIADGSNYKSLIEQWRLTGIKQKIPFHYTGEKGAFIIN